MIELLDKFAAIVEDEKIVKKHLFIAGQFMQVVPNEINVLPKPGTYKHPFYGEIKITRERNQEFITNFNNEIYQKLIPIDLEHETTLSGAVGYFEPGTGRIADDGGGWISVRWEDRGIQALNEGRFLYFSPTWFDKWTDPMSGKKYNNVLVGGALTNHPFYKDNALKPLFASELKEASMENNNEGEAGGTGGASGSGNVSILSSLTGTNVVISTPSGTYSGDNWTITETTDSTGKNYFTFQYPDVIITEGTSKTQGSKMENDKVDPVKFKEMEEKLARFTELEEQAKTLQDELKKANESLARQAVADRQRHFKEVIRGIDAEGDGAKAFKGDVKVHAQVLEALVRTYGEDSEEFKSYVLEMRSLAEQLDASELLKEKGGVGSANPESTSEDKAVVEYMSKVATVMSERKVSELEAQAIVAKDSPKLYNDYRRASYKKGEE